MCDPLDEGLLSRATRALETGITVISPVVIRATSSIVSQNPLMAGSSP